MKKNKIEFNFLVNKKYKDIKEQVLREIMRYNLKHTTETTDGTVVTFSTYGKYSKRTAEIMLAYIEKEFKEINFSIYIDGKFVVPMMDIEDEIIGEQYNPSLYSPDLRVI